ncbi:MAG: hypothetical protein AB4372_26305 [Xenococcus sp. (in: cyanobacteria)]
MKNKKKFSEKYLKTLLTSLAEINNFYILKEGSEDIGGLMHYLSSDGALYINLEENDDLAMACVKFLEKKGVPVFTDIYSLKKYEEELLNNNKS